MKKPFKILPGLFSGLLFVLTLSAAPALWAIDGKTESDRRPLKASVMTTSKKINVSVKPVGKSFRGSQPINKIDSKVRFHDKDSDFLYFTLKGEQAYNQFRLVFMESQADSSQVYIGYYEEDESHVIDSAIANSTLSPLLVKDVMARVNETDPAVNSAAALTYSGKPETLKTFIPVSTLSKVREYSIEVAWKSTASLTSISMSSTDRMTYTATPSLTSTLSASLSSSPVSITQTEADTLATIPEHVSAQITLRNKDGDVLMALDLDLALSHFSVSDAAGELLAYKLDGSRIQELNKARTQKYRVHDNEPGPVDDKDDSSEPVSKEKGVGMPVGYIVAIPACAALFTAFIYYEANRKANTIAPYKKSLVI